MFLAGCVMLWTTIDLSTSHPQFANHKQVFKGQALVSFAPCHGRWWIEQCSLSWGPNPSYRFWVLFCHWDGFWSVKNSMYCLHLVASRHRLLEQKMFTDSISLLAGMWRMRVSTRVFGICILQILLSMKQLRHAWSWIGSSALAWYTFFLRVSFLDNNLPDHHPPTLEFRHWSIDIYCWILLDFFKRHWSTAKKNRKKCRSVASQRIVQWSFWMLKNYQEAVLFLKAGVGLLSWVVCFAVISAEQGFLFYTPILCPSPCMRPWRSAIFFRLRFHKAAHVFFAALWVLEIGANDKKWFAFSRLLQMAAGSDNSKWFYMLFCFAIGNLRSDGHLFAFVMKRPIHWQIVAMWQL